VLSIADAKTSLRGDLNERTFDRGATPVHPQAVRYRTSY
jgi:hypothetical protein